MMEAAGLEARLSHVRLDSDAVSTAAAVPVGKPRAAVPGAPGVPDVGFSPNTQSLLQAGLADDGTEAAMRDCFNEAFQREVDYLRSLNVSVSKERRCQILADILVWAEVTQSHYDVSTQSFVLEPNLHDESFQRVGRFFREAKAALGLA